MRNKLSLKKEEVENELEMTILCICPRKLIPQLSLFSLKIKMCQIQNEYIVMQPVILYLKL